MSMTDGRHHRVKAVIEAVLMAAAFMFLIDADNFYMPFFVVAVSAFLCFAANQKQKITLNKSAKWLIAVFTALFTLIITSANYTIWANGRPEGYIVLFFVLGGTVSAFRNIFTYLYINVDRFVYKTSVPVFEPPKSFYKPRNVFIITFVIIIAINLTLLFLCFYPGNLTVDSMWQMEQLLQGKYTNHHPFYHTITIKLFIMIGTRLFNNINAAVAVFSSFSIVLMAAIFAFAAATVAAQKPPKKLVVFLIMFFALMPYHIVYSFTMWKDVFFGGFCLLFTIFLFRCISKANMTVFNLIGFSISGLLVCLYRSNGLFAFILSMLCFFALYRLKYKKILTIMVLIMAASIVLKYPVLKALNVTQPDLVESLSIPVQQISKDIQDHDDFTDSQRALLQSVVDFDQVRAAYNRAISDPIKNHMRQKGNQENIRQNKWQFIGLYFDRFFKYPITYAHAWIDQTKGYWNSGYIYWRWACGICGNGFGIERSVKSQWLLSKVNDYLWRFENLRPLQLFLCIGFFSWLALVSLFISLCRKDKAGVMVALPVIMVIVSLLVATPVFAEFRYAYSLFCTVPVMLALALSPIEEQ